VIKNPNQITPQELNLVDQVSDEVIKARQVMFSADVQRGLLFLCLVIAVFFVGLKYNKFKWPALALLALIIMGDQWSVCHRYLNSDKEKGKYMRYVKAEEMVVPAAPTAADLMILDKESKLVNAASFESKKGEILSKMNEESDWKKFKNSEEKGQIASFAALNLSSHYRVLTLQNPFSNADVSYLHKSIGGYHGAKLKRYQELIEFCIQPEMERMVDSLRKVGMNYNFKSTPVLNMLNTKYITYSAENPPLENRNVCGAAWFVGKVNLVKSANDEILALQNMDTRNEAVVNESFSKAFNTSGKDSLDSVHLLEYSPNKLTYESKSKNAGAIVFSEIYYPKGWICTVDGQPVETAQVNFVLRGIQVPAGKHEIVWSFEPEVWKTSTKLSGLGSGLMLLMILGGLFIERKKRMNVAE
jgi:hypothetical protein